MNILTKILDFILHAVILVFVIGFVVGLMEAFKNWRFRRRTRKDWDELIEYANHKMKRGGMEKKLKLGEIVEDMCCSCCRGSVTQREIENEESDCCHTEIVEYIPTAEDFSPRHPDDN